ncbi:hypothetical protein JCM11251_000649 [Rhodosporidiobolus azoricus]
MPFQLLTSGYGGEIYSLSLDLSASPALQVTSTESAGNAPTWLILSSDGKRVYTGDEFSSPNGTLSAFNVDEDGKLSPLSSAQSGEGPVHFAISHDGRNLYSANYGSGTLTHVRLDKDGSFAKDEEVTYKFAGTGPNTERQEMPHIHGVYIDPTGEYLLATDLGSDQLKVYRINGDKLDALTPISLTPGVGPRHLVISPPSNSQSKTLLYLVEELTSAVSIYEIVYPSQAGGNFSLASVQKEISVLPPDYKSYAGDWTAAEISLSADKRFLYVSNRAPLDPHPESDTLTIFELNAQGSVVEGAEPTYFALGGRGPRDFAFSPKKDGVAEGKYLAVPLQRTNEVVVYEVDGKKLDEVARVKDIKEPTTIVWL